MASTTTATTTTTTSYVAPGSLPTATSNTPNHGLMHSIKEKMFHGEKHVDSDYDASAAHFNQLHQSIVNLRASASNYISSVYSVFLNGNNVSVEFANILTESPQPHPYQNITRQFRAAHNRLHSEKQQAIAADLTDRVVKPLDEQLKAMIPLHQRIAKRNELHAQLEYYINKMHTLTKERDERGAKGKAEKPAATEKFERNVLKLETARQNYASFTAALMADLNNAWLARIAMLGPALASFIEGEKRFMQIMNEELSGPMDHSEGLVEAPASAYHERVSSTDIPAPVLAGDVQLAPVSTLAPTAMATIPVTTTTTVEKTVTASHVDRDGLVHLDQTPKTTHTTNTTTDHVPVPLDTVTAAPVPVPSYANSNPFDSPTPAAVPTQIPERDILGLKQQPGGVVIQETTTVHPIAPVVDSYGLGDVNAQAPLSTASADSFTPALTLKSQGEEESKRQRFENDQKNALVL